MRWRTDVVTGLGLYEVQVLTAATSGPPGLARFFGMTAHQITSYFDARKDETDNHASFALLASTEAILRTDYARRVRARGKDAVSRAFRTINKEQREKVSLDAHILQTWVDHHPACSAYVAAFRGTLKLRNWLAHGGYWRPKLGRSYSFDDVYDIVTRLVRSLPGLVL